MHRVVLCDLKETEMKKKSIIESTRNIFIIFIIFLPSICWGETYTIDDLYIRGESFFKKSDDLLFTGSTSGRIHTKFKNGKQEGEWLEYYRNKTIKTMGENIKGSAEGQWVWYHENGKEYRKGSFNKGKQEGKWLEYQKNGSLLFEQNFKDGKQEGEWLSYYKNGQLFLKGKYQGGKQQGEWIWYYDNGKINMKKYYKDGSEVKF